MKLDQQLNDYILTHPDFWEFDDEVKEVERLKGLIAVQKLFNLLNPVTRDVKVIDD